MEFEAVTYGARKTERPAAGRFLDLTDLFEAEGFHRIQARRSFFAGGGVVAYSVRRGPGERRFEFRE